MVKVINNDAPVKGRGGRYEAPVAETQRLPGAFVQKMRPVASGMHSETGAHFCAGK
jgi:hypothetical protein